MKKIIIFTLLSFWPLLTFSQKRDSVSFGFTLILPEYNKADITDFNIFLASNNTPKASYWPFSVGFGVNMTYKKFRLNIIGNMLQSFPDKDSDTTVTNSTSFLGIELEYHLFKSKYFTIYPFVGVKEAIIDYQFKTKQSYTLSSYLISPIYNKNLEYRRTNFDFGFGIETGKQFKVGIKSGIYLPFNNGSWKVEDNTIKKDIPVIDYKYFCNFYLTIPFK
jgi:hypothetical protein